MKRESENDERKIRGTRDWEWKYRKGNLVTFPASDKEILLKKVTDQFHFSNTEAQYRIRESLNTINTNQPIIDSKQKRMFHFSFFTHPN